MVGDYRGDVAEFELVVIIADGIGGGVGDAGIRAIAV